MAAITDEFSPDLELALDAMTAAGIEGAELRLVNGTNVVDLTDREADLARLAVERRRMTVVGIASPLLKCVLPGGPPLVPDIQQDVFGSRYAFSDQTRLTDRALTVAERVGAPLIRVFSYWRTTDPEACQDRVVSALGALANRAQDRGVIIGLENEFACNVGTGGETARLLEALQHPALKVIWDPANAFILGETPFPDGYSQLPLDRIAHVHAKDCVLSGHTPVWGCVGDMGIDWRGQLAALRRDRYAGWISLETHWTGPTGDKLEASTLCAGALRDLIADNRS